MTSGKTTAVAKTTGAEKSGQMLERLLGMAVTPEERQHAYRAVERYNQQKLIQEMADLVLSESWGNKVSAALRFQMVSFCLDIGGDPLRHMDVLGGKPYLNAAFYMELTASQSDFHHAEEFWAHDTDELTEDEKEVRRLLRAKHAIPTAIAATVGLFRDQRSSAAGKPPIPVKAACVIYLHFKDRGPFYGVKWTPSRAVDDVGMDHPEQTARTRAWRKAALQAVSPWFKRHPMLAKMEELVIQARTFDVKEALPPGPVAGEDTKLQQIEGPQGEGEAPSAPEAPGPKVTKHEPSGICKLEGEHQLEDCGYELRKKIG